MDLSQGYIRLFRQFLDWEWYDDANTMRLFVHCLLLANSENKQWRGINIKRGQFITSQSKLAHSLKLSIKQIRGSLNKLKTTGEVAVDTTSEYSIITVKNYNSFQQKGRREDTQKDTPKDRQGAGEGQQLINNSNTSYINISLSIEERENLKKYLLSKKKNIQDVDAYIRKLLDNGDIQIILDRAKKWQAKQEQKKESEGVNEENNIVEITPEEDVKIREIQEKIKKRRRTQQ